jgi:hypothetical protein
MRSTACLETTRAILRFNSSAWAGFGRAESAFTIAPSVLTSRAASYGSGSEPMPSTIASWADPERIAELRQDLLAYCGRDTQAIVELFNLLR